MLIGSWLSTAARAGFDGTELVLLDMHRNPVGRLGALPFSAAGTPSAPLPPSHRALIDPFAARRYRGGSPLASAFFTVFRATPSRRAIAAIGMPSALRSRRISAQSSTFNTS